MGGPGAPVARRIGHEPSFDEATCTRSLCPDGTLWEVVRLDKIGEGGEQPTDEELNTWIAGFPIEPLQGGQGFNNDEQDFGATTQAT